jgi:tetratricopeptide (TPR) repeat protein
LRATAYRDIGAVARAGVRLATFERRQAARLPAGHIAFSALASEQALLAEARGDFALAAAAADRAVAIAAASSQGRELLARALLRRATLALALGGVDDAVADARRGLTLEIDRAEASSPSSILGRAYFTWGQTLRAARRPDEAREAVTQAVRHFESALGSDNRETRSARELLATLE